MMCPADDQTAKVMQNEQTFDLPAAAITARLAPVLSRNLLFDARTAAAIVLLFRAQAIYEKVIHPGSLSKDCDCTKAVQCLPASNLRAALSAFPTE